ncbi:aspartate dehydrogenase [Methylobacterium sp. J-068]|uniref:aspartate dehydrogenase n=1 Tax=Methylobacterium sp. J-068 TaxID=2836649 RepID=UPI001FB94DC5|nr:aspartate dehydrogenase [Methylobacterium sp. J-068]MCJ2034139.1 aspartate dehydrogenase [Methylobacterium sp. J-068]
MSSSEQTTAESPSRGTRPLRIAMVGWGAIARRVVQLLDERSRPIVLVGVGTRTQPEGGSALPEGVRWLAGPETLAGARIDMVIEAAGRDAVEPWGSAALCYARSFAVSSTSAFCEEGVLDRLLASAEAHGSQILVPTGALAGMDALAAASILPLSEVTHRIVKPPQAWFGTPAERAVDLHALSRETVFFEGSARDAARSFPANANVAVITALAGIGLDRTFVQLVADPTASGNGHRLRASGAFGTMEIWIENRPLATNPKSSELTALALVRTIESRVLPLSL